MSKRAGLHPKANSKNKSNRSPLAKVHGLMLFGSAPLLLQGEDAAAYDHHSRCGVLGMGGLALASLADEFDASASAQST